MQQEIQISFQSF